MECGRILSYLLYGSVASLPSPSSNLEAWPNKRKRVSAKLISCLPLDSLRDTEYQKPSTEEVYQKQKDALVRSTKTMSASACSFSSISFSSIFLSSDNCSSVDSRTSFRFESWTNLEQQPFRCWDEASLQQASFQVFLPKSRYCLFIRPG